MRKMKSDAELRRRLALLGQRGVSPLLHAKPPARELVDLIGDLTLCEIYHMGELAFLDQQTQFVQKGKPPTMLSVVPSPE